MNLGVSVARRLRSPEFDQWLQGASRTGYCSNPVRLSGESTTLAGESGEVLAQFSSATQPDGLTYVRCGNRRARRCASCSHEYKGDTWHMIMAGAAGGMKGVPETISAHPMVFLTLTAPSFGAVHSLGRTRRSGVCMHGKARACECGHAADDPKLGEPICADCYDYAGHIAWQFHAPELWRRFTIMLRRRLARELGMSNRAASEIVRLQFAKVAEFQRRGAVHFHAIVRLDGVDDVDPFPAPPLDATESVLVRAIRSAACDVVLPAPRLPGEVDQRELRWGTQMDVQAIVQREGLDGSLSDRAVAAYIAKYATKATEDIGGAGRRVHLDRLKAVASEIAEVAESDSAYLLLGKWAHMLGFRGHFSTKSRRYSVTLGSLRGARRRWRLERLIERASVDENVRSEDVLVIGAWSFAGMGWLTDGDRALALEASRAARDWHDSRRERPIQREGNDHA
ncbi:replication initiator [Microbacterium sp. NPDC077644]|uniref:replication initiator n=1 Tax=Microbacterium sp. NPDC077644 TaxID=3155055 RepID=UPI00344B83F3